MIYVLTGKCGLLLVNRCTFLHGIEACLNDLYNNMIFFDSLDILKNLNTVLLRLVLYHAMINALTTELSSEFVAHFVLKNAEA
jgi:hypothetical protein